MSFPSPNYFPLFKNSCINILHHNKSNSTFQMRPLGLVLLFSLTPLLLCQPYSTGYFTNVTLYTPSSYFNNWLFPTSSYLVAYQFLGSSGTQALLPNFITSICLQIYNSTYNSSHSVQLSVPISYD